MNFICYKQGFGSYLSTTLYDFLSNILLLPRHRFLEAELVDQSTRMVLRPHGRCHGIILKNVGGTNVYTAHSPPPSRACAHTAHGACCVCKTCLVAKPVFVGRSTSSCVSSASTGGSQRTLTFPYHTCCRHVLKTLILPRCFIFLCLIYSFFLYF